MRISGTKLGGVINKKKTITPKENGEITKTDDEINRYLLEKYFRKDDQNEDTDAMKSIRSDNTDYITAEESAICEEKLITTIKSLKGTKQRARIKSRMRRCYHYTTL